MIIVRSRRGSTPQLLALRSAVVAAVLAGMSCHKAAEVPPAPPLRPALPVRVSMVRKQHAARQVAIDAPLAGIKQADIYTKTVGRVTYIGPAEGAAVKAGEVLFRIDRSDPGESFLNMPTPSPISGWIGRWRVTTIGEQVTPSEPVVTIVDDRSLRVIAYLPADDWTEVTSATQVTAAFGDEERPARIISIARSADSSSGRGSVTLEIANPKRDWRVGTFVRLRFALNPKERLLISSAALVITDQGAYVYTVTNDVVQRLLVRFRVVDPDTVEILSGLADQSQLVVAGANLLSDKSPVKVTL